MLLTDEYMKLGPILRISADIVAEGYSGKEDFLKRASKEIKGTEIKIETIQKVASRLELFLF